MIRWDYYKVRKGAISINLIELGASGWELVTVICDVAVGPEPLWIFKRPRGD